MCMISSAITNSTKKVKNALSHAHFISCHLAYVEDNWDMQTYGKKKKKKVGKKEEQEETDMTEALYLPLCPTV